MKSHEESSVKRTSTSQDIAVGLVHYPVKDKNGNEVATSITNFDIHDIARVCKVYNIRRYYIIHKSAEQLMFVSRLLDHWKTGEGSKHNHLRQEALRSVYVAASVEEAVNDWNTSSERQVIATSAKTFPDQSQVSFSELRESMVNQPTFLLFGTGYGLSARVINASDHILEPIKGTGGQDYRHLSVRSAVSICLDRLLGSW